VLDYVQQRKQFGRPIVEFQAVQIKLAEMKLRVEAARLLIHRAASNAQDGMPSILDSSLAKCFANEISREVTGTAVQLMGGYGYSKEYPMERRLRDSWGGDCWAGAIDIQKVNIASALVGTAVSTSGARRDNGYGKASRGLCARGQDRRARVSEAVSVRDRPSAARQRMAVPDETNRSSSWQRHTSSALCGQLADGGAGG
jgi:hypothetical protein